MKLVIVESPTKVKTIKKYLGKGYKVVASMGHIVDLPKNELGVDVEKDFEPKYIVTNSKVLKYLKDSFKNIDTLVVASDLDREGEAIGWHIAQRLKVIDKTGRLRDKDKKLERIVFNSITKEAVLKAVKSPREIDFDLVNAQQARRILDRLVGYKLSPLLWKKISYGLSAGRVQSVAVRLIVDREEERDRFKPDEYWSILSDLSVKKLNKNPSKVVLKSDDGDKNKKKFKGIKFELTKYKNKKVDISNEKDAGKIIDYVYDKKWIISNIEEKEAHRNPKPPFITSTLQRVASNIFGYSSRKTMTLAQKLYEAGFITYMRTDSYNIVKTELKKIRSYIESEYGKKYLSPKIKRYKSKSKNIQEAHEAIRPTDISKSVEELKLKGQLKKLYNLIRNRTLACQMSKAKVKNTTLGIKIGDYLFISRGQIIVFKGYLQVYREHVSENVLPELELKTRLYPRKILGCQHFTSPPPHYSEASLIKTLEKYGIGRPSTYAPIISTICRRKYVIKEGRYFRPTEIGKVVTKLLKKYFEQIVDTGFTAGIEEDLDLIASGEIGKLKIIKEFYKPFIKNVKRNEKQIKRDEFTVLGPSKYKCPICKKKMVKKISRYGVFLSCVDFPKCKGMRSLDGKSEKDKRKEIKKQVNSDEFKSKYLPAPKTSDGKRMILKSGRYGKFWAHPDYPKVKETEPLKLKEKCPKCGSPLVERKGKWGKPFIGCSAFPKCKYIKKTKGKK